MKPEKTERANSPLSTAAQYILLALAGSDLHGYGIVQQVRHLSSGSYSISPGTLYDNLKKLMRSGFVIDAPRLANKQTDDDRRFYRITKEGLRTLDLEVWRLQEVVSAHSRLRRPKNA